MYRTPADHRGRIQWQPSSVHELCEPSDELLRVIWALHRLLHVPLSDCHLMICDGIRDLGQGIKHAAGVPIVSCRAILLDILLQSHLIVALRVREL